MRDRFHWTHLLAFVTGLVNQELLLRNEYLAAENRTLKARLPSRFDVTTPVEHPVVEALYETRVIRPPRRSVPDPPRA